MSVATHDITAITANSGPELRKRRLRWQCRRGMRELDLMLLAFVDQRYDPLSDTDQRCFEQMLQNPDQLLLAWLMGHQQPTDPHLAKLVAHIRRPAESSGE